MIDRPWIVHNCHFVAFKKLMNYCLTKIVLKCSLIHWPHALFNQNGFVNFGLSLYRALYNAQNNWLRRWVNDLKLESLGNFFEWEFTYDSPESFWRSATALKAVTNWMIPTNQSAKSESFRSKKSPILDLKFRKWAWMNLCAFPFLQSL